MVHADQKPASVLRLLEVENFDALIAFVRTKQATLDLAELLERQGYRVSALNGDMPQAQREKTIESLKDGSLDIVVATDVARAVWTWRASPTCSTWTCPTIPSPMCTVSVVPVVPVVKAARCCWSPRASGACCR